MNDNDLFSAPFGRLFLGIGRRHGVHYAYNLQMQRKEKLVAITWSFRRVYMCCLQTWVDHPGDWVGASISRLANWSSCHVRKKIAKIALKNIVFYESVESRTDLSDISKELSKLYCLIWLPVWIFFVRKAVNKVPIISINFLTFGQVFSSSIFRRGHGIFSLENLLQIATLMHP